MIVHSLQTHPRDEWCLDFHLSAYAGFCDAIVVAVDSDPEYAAKLRKRWYEGMTVIDFDGRAGVPEGRVNEQGVLYQERQIRQAAMDGALKLDPSLIVFGDTDEVPTLDVREWIREAAAEPQRECRWYVHWVTLFQDFHHAIGGDSVWSFESRRGNKKCLAMQPGRDMRYVGDQHCGMEPGRNGGGSAPTGPNRYLIDSPKMLHLKYGAKNLNERPESKLKRHDPAVMLENGRIVTIPDGWLWPAMLVA